MEKFTLGRYLWGNFEVFTRMKKNQETAHTILLEILNGTRPLTEDGIRALVQEDPEIAVLLILEQARRLRDILGSKQRKAASTPSGMIPPHEKPNTQKDKKKKQQRGRKPGHKGACRKNPDTITQTVEHPPLEICPHCQGPVTPCKSASATRTRIIEDIPASIEPVVTQHVIPRSYCPHCKKLVEPPVVDALPKATLGNQVLTLSAFWHYGLGMPSQQIADILDSHLNTEISLGGLFGMWTNLAIRLEPWYKALMNELLMSAVLHGDESGWRVNGKTHWLWCFANQDITFYMIHASRGDPALFEFLKETFDGVLVSDFWACYSHIDTTHQYCLAHLLRELKKVDGLNASVEWQNFSKKAKRLFGDALRLYYKEGYEPEKYASRIERIQLRLIDLMLIESTDADVNRLAKRLRKYWDELLVFLEKPYVPPTNNTVEQQIRFAVVMRKVCQGNQSEKGAWVQSILMTIFRTLKRRGLNPVAEVVNALKTWIATGTLPPFPAPTVAEG